MHFIAFSSPSPDTKGKKEQLHITYTYGHSGGAMNREALPLIVAIVAPIIIVGIIVLYIYGYDFTRFIREIDIIYYIILFPIVLGLIFAVIKWK